MFGLLNLNQLTRRFVVLSSFFKKEAELRLFLFIFVRSHDKYSTNLTTNYKSVDGVLETQTQVSRMVGADESTEL